MNKRRPLAILVIAMLLVPALALILTSQVKVVAASPDPDIENLWVDSLDVRVMEWWPVGTSPYLDAQDQPTNYVDADDGGDIIGDFYFANLSSSGTINSVTLYVYGISLGGNEKLLVYLWDGDWDNYNEFTGSGWQWYSVDVTSVLDTYTKVNNAKIYLESIKVKGYQPVLVDAAYLEVDYTVPPPGKPTLTDPENGITTADTTPTFSWENGLYASKHRIEVDDDIDFSSVIDNENSTGNSWTPASGYSVGTYYWRVWAVNSAGENVSDNIWEFTITTWWDTNWNNRRKIEISPLNPENYQLKIFFENLDNLTGVKSDLSDLRFLENVVTSEILPHWVENYTVDNATVWVRRLENADNSIYVYYANPSVDSIENGDNVFVLFDNFDRDSVDETKWDNLSDGGGTVSNSIYTAIGAAGSVIGIQSDISFDTTVIFRVRAKLTTTTAPFIEWGNFIDRPDIYFEYDSGTHRARTLGPSSGLEDTNLSESAGIWYTYEIRRPSGNQEFYLDDALKGTHTTYNITTSWPIGFRVASDNSKIEADWVVVRKFVSSEPDTTVGAQEPPPVLPTKPTLYFPVDSSTITDETPRFEWTKGKNADNHQLLVSSDNTFTTIIENVVRGFENYYEILSDNFLSDGKYWWRVSAMSENGENISTTWSFTMKALTTFEYSSGVDKLWAYADDEELFEVEMSADGEFIAFGTYVSGEIKFFRRTDNTVLWTDDTLGGNVGSVSLSDNGQYVAAGSGIGGGIVRLYDNVGNIKWTSPGYTYIRKKTVKMSGDARYVTGGTESGKVLLFDGIFENGDAGSGTAVWEYTTGDKIREVAISEKTADNRYFIAAVSEDYNVYLFDNDDNVPIWTYKTGYKAFSVDISDNGNRVVVGSWDNRIYLFDNVDNVPIWTYELTDNTYHIERHMWFTVSISDDGQYIVGGVDEQEGWYYLFDNNDNVPIWTYNEFGQEVRDVKISGDGSRIVGGGWGGRIYCWSRDDNIPIWYYGESAYRPGAVAISEDGSLVAVDQYKSMHLLQDGTFAYELLTEGQLNPRRVLTTTPEFSFKLPSRRIENTVSFRIEVGENETGSEMWSSTWDIENEENEVYRTYAGRTLSLYKTYWWRIKLEDNENNWSAWSVSRNFEIVELLDFPYYKTVSFGGDISDNYQVKVVIQDTPNMDENLRDLLFYDSTYPSVGLPYWIENIEENIVWVKVHDNNSIKMYYGNDNVGDASNGDDTFPDLFDNFSGTSVDFTKWSSRGNPSVSDGELSLTNTQYVWAKETFGVNLALRVRANIGDSADNLYIGFVKFDPNSGDVATPSAHFWGRENRLYLRTALAGETARTTSNSFSDYLGDNTIYEIKRIGTDNVELWANDDNLVVSSSTNIPSARVTIYIQAPSGAGTIKVDWVFLRKSLAVEPTVTVGGEENRGWKQIENWTGRIENPRIWNLIDNWSGLIEAPTAIPVIENLYITDMDNVAADNLAPETQYKFWVEISDNDNLADIENVTLVIYLDNENLPDNAVDHYTFTWNRTGTENIPPNVIGTSTTWGAFAYTFQRKTFYASGRYWAFYSDGTKMVHRSSVDGVVWSNAENIRDSVGADFSVWFDGTYLHYAYSNVSSIYYRRGIPNSNGTITWSAVEQTVSTTYDNARIPFISVDTLGYAWVGYKEQLDNNYQHPFVIKSGNNDGTWGTTPGGFPYQLKVGVQYNIWYVTIVPLTDNKMYAVYMQDYDPPLGKLWDGSSWENEETIDADIGYEGRKSSVVVNDDNIYFVYLSRKLFPARYYIRFKIRTYGVGWENEENIQEAVEDGTGPTLSINQSTGDLYFFWTGSPTDNRIYYKKYTASTTTWDASPTEFYNDTDGLKYDIVHSTFYQAQNNMIGVAWTSKTASPYDVKFATLGLGSSGQWTSSPSGYLITDNSVAGDNTKTVDNFIFAIEFGEDATVTANDNWDVWVQVYDSYGNEDNRFFLNQFDIVSPFAWELIETWTGTVEAPVAWLEIENWSGSVEAPAGWQLIETWTGTLEAPVAWQLIETWTGTVEAVSQWELIESWSGTVQAPSVWQLIETWTGSVEAAAAWQLIETWAGTVQALSEWTLIESWDGTVQAPAVWGLISTWSGTVEAPVTWNLIETWTGTVEAFSGWQLIETWDGTVEAFSGWQLIEEWTGTVEAFAEWQLIETWTGTVQTPSIAVWNLLETWTGDVQSPAEWQSIENWSGTIQAPVEWLLIETWSGTIESPTAWQLISTWTGTIEAPSVWDLIDTWTGTVQAPSEWSEIENWTGSVTAVGWTLIESWGGTVQTHGWLLVESWTGSIRTPAVYAVSISITPSENSGTLGATLTYTVIVTNIGGTLDNYDLTSSDAQGWAVYLDDNVILNMASGASGNTTLNVGLSTLGTHTINVTVTSQGDGTVSDTASTTAISATAGEGHPGGIIGGGSVALGIAALAVGLAVVALVFILMRRREDEEEEG